MKTQKPHCKRLLGSPVQLAVLALLAGSGAGYAQTAQTATQNAQTASEALPEVVITATKRATTLQSTPIAVTSISAAELDKHHVQTVQDIAALVPSFQGILMSEVT